MKQHMIKMNNSKIELDISIRGLIALFIKIRGTAAQIGAQAEKTLEEINLKWKL